MLALRMDLKHATTWRRGTESWYLAYALLGASAAGLVPILLPLMVYEMSGAAYTGLVVAAYNCGGLTAPLWGGLADRYRLHRSLLGGGLLLAALGLTAFPFAPDLPSRTGLALLQGMGASGAATVANLFVVEAHPEREWEERIGWLQTFYATGQVFGLLLAGALSRTSLSIGLFTAAGLMLLAALLGWATTRTPSLALPQKPVVMQPPRHGEWPIGSPQHLFHHWSPEMLQGWGRNLCSPFALFLLSWLFAFAGSWGFFSLYPVLMQQVFGVSPWLLSIGSAVAHGLGLFLFVPAGLWSERQGPERVLGSALSMRLLAFTALFGLGFVAFGGQGWLALSCVIVVILSWSLLSVSGTALVAHLSQMGEGEGMGLFNATTALAGITGSALGGWVAEQWGYQASLGLPVAGVAVGLLLTRCIRRDHTLDRSPKFSLGQGDS